MDSSSESELSLVADVFSVLVGCHGEIGSSNTIVSPSRVWASVAGVAAVGSFWIIALGWCYIEHSVFVGVGFSTDAILFHVFCIN